jgi:preprotein translocase subunit SecG
MSPGFQATLVSAIHVFTCILLILLVLIQSGKGAEISASFSGSSQTVFGSSGGANFFVTITRVAAAVFFVTSITLTVMGSASRKSIFETGANSAPLAPSQNAPVAPADPKSPAAPADPLKPSTPAKPAAPAQKK